MKFIYFFIIATILFIIYVEFSVGNIIWREGANGLKSFQPKNIIHYLINPIYNSFLWNIRLLDVNYVFMMVMSTIFYYNIYKFDYLYLI